MYSSHVGDPTMLQRHCAADPLVGVVGRHPRARVSPPPVSSLVVVLFPHLCWPHRQSRDGNRTASHFATTFSARPSLRAVSLAVDTRGEGMGRGGGGGGLRLLPHKSWNVYGFDQIQKVKADEAKHAGEQAVLAAKKRKNDAEFRLQVMRNRLERQRQQGTNEADDDVDADSHRNNNEAPDEEDNAQEYNDAALVDGGEADLGVHSHKRRRLSGPQPESAESSTTATPRMRYVVQQEAIAATDGPVSSPSLPSSSFPPPQAFTLFPEVELSSKSAAMARTKAAESRAAEIAHARRVAPATLFVESLRDRSSGVDALRPWYAASEEERLAVEQRTREAAKKSVQLERDAQGRLRLRTNPNGDIRQTLVDPLEEMRGQLQRLREHERRERPDDLDSQPVQDAPPPPLATPDAGAHTAIPRNDLQALVRNARTQAESYAQARRAAQLPPSSNPPAADLMPPLQPQSVWNPLATVASSESHVAVASTSSSSPSQVGRRTRWDVSAAMHFAPHVGFTNDTAAATAAAATPPTPLFAAAVAAAAHPWSPSRGSRSRNDSASSSSDSSSSDSSSKSDSDSSSRGHSRERRNSSHKKKHKKKDKESRSHRESKKKKKNKASKKERRRDCSRSRSRERDRKSTKRSSKDKNNQASSLSSHLLSAPLRSAADLRLERESRERVEREKAAALLQVPSWATADRRTITQNEFKDDAPPPEQLRRRGGLYGRRA